jgi:hypothetical protein
MSLSHKQICLQDNEMIELFVTLMKSNIDVGIVTAAGYPGEASKFENRIQGLLKAFSQYRLPATITNRCEKAGCFHVCTYVPFVFKFVHLAHILRGWASPTRLVPACHSCPMLSLACGCVIQLASLLNAATPTPHE